MAGLARPPAVFGRLGAIADRVAAARSGANTPFADGAGAVGTGVADCPRGAATAGASTAIDVRFGAVTNVVAASEAAASTPLAYVVLAVRVRNAELPRQAKGAASCAVHIDLGSVLDTVGARRQLANAESVAHATGAVGAEATMRAWLASRAVTSAIDIGFIPVPGSIVAGDRWHAAGGSWWATAGGAGSTRHTWQDALVSACRACNGSNTPFTTGRHTGSRSGEGVVVLGAERARHQENRCSTEAQPTEQGPQNAPLN